MLFALFALCALQFDAFGAVLIYRGTVAGSSTTSNGTSRFVDRIILLYDTTNQQIRGFTYRKPDPIPKYYHLLFAPDTRIYPVGTTLKSSTVISNHSFIDSGSGGFTSFDRLLSGLNAELKVNKSLTQVTIAPRILNGTHTFEIGSPGGSRLDKAKITLRLDLLTTRLENETGKSLATVSSDEEKKLIAAGYAFAF